MNTNGRIFEESVHITLTDSRGTNLANLCVGFANPGPYAILSSLNLPYKNSLRRSWKGVSHPFLLQRVLYEGVSYVTCLSRTYSFSWGVGCGPKFQLECRACDDSGKPAHEALEHTFDS